MLAHVCVCVCVRVCARAHMYMHVNTYRKLKLCLMGCGTSAFLANAANLMQQVIENSFGLLLFPTL